MKNKKRIFVILLLILILTGAIFWLVNMYKEENIEVVELMPEEEISEEQLRQTMLSLYFKNKESNELMPEGRLIDVKKLINNPYEELVNLLIEGPKNSKLESVIPNGTKINKTQLNGDVLELDLSKEFIENHKGGEEAERLTIDSIVKTLTELTEVNSVKILIDGQEDMCFKDQMIKFDKPFVKAD